jgi:hypothetical protein
MPRQSPVEWISATLPKAGNHAEENEDAAAAAPEVPRFAVADGATEGWESRPWARHLARAYARRAPGPDDFDRWLGQAREGWVPPAADAAPVAWYAAEKQDQGSFATLLGVELQPSRTQPGWWTWKAVAVGDSCLLHVRDDELEAAFPFADPSSFGTRPRLVPSSAATPCPEPEWHAGRAAPGDVLLLATDAAAARLLTPPALGAALAAVRAALGDRDPAPLLSWFREVQQAINDDVTMIAIRLPDVP